MLPMVATVEEFTRGREIVAREIAYLRRHGHAMPTDIAIGVMIEVPALLFQIREICALADFISGIGIERPPAIPLRRRSLRTGRSHNAMILWGWPPCAPFA